MDNARLIGFEPTEMSEMAGEDVTGNEAATIEAPTFILTGDQSPEMYLLVSLELARYLPHAEQAQIAGAAHVLHSMNPRAYNTAVLSFLARHGS
jgi:pimeloyl-ACP methyl ester carboxylesterase